MCKDLQALDECGAKCGARQYFLVVASRMKVSVPAPVSLSSLLMWADTRRRVTFATAAKSTPTARSSTATAGSCRSSRRTSARRRPDRRPLGQRDPLRGRVTALAQAPIGRRLRLRLALILGGLTAFAPLSIDMYLPGLPAPGLVAAATRDADYKRWTRDFLGGS